jgi:hypothetical protein
MAYTSKSTQDNDRISFETITKQCIIRIPREKKRIKSKLEGFHLAAELDRHKGKLVVWVQVHQSYLLFGK